MKTDLIEIFQTIRASLQPYATLGFDNRTNSETLYDLWSNKNVEIDGTLKNEVFFTSVSIEDSYVSVRLLPDEMIKDLKEIAGSGLSELLTDAGYFKITELDDALLAHVEEAVAATFKVYKDNGWVV
ncbi:MAG: hypothetical protein WKF66_05605 [Pedobacter sp.]